MTNKLINETSPYLLQHKDNPVSWYSWNTETLSYAKNQKLPILLSIGYSSCHWCHVMAHESFENNKIASIMNSNFINIKVDREERPDIDSLYQASLSLMGQQGGWPLTMFLDNKLIPFWGGTYFPSIRKHGLPSFTDVLGHIKNIYINNKHQVIHNTSAISESLKKIYGRPSLTDYSVNDIEELTILINQSFDPISGGLQGAPKFPMVPMLRSLFFIIFSLSQKVHGVLNNIQSTAKNLCSGGIYDHLAGGFSRYSVDEQWFVPHFEKMLYDNAQLVEFLSNLSLVDNCPVYAARVKKTITWLDSDMLVIDKNSHAYFSAMDADSEGVEGLFYVWTYKEILDALGESAKEFAAQYGVQESGNWEGKNILHRINKSASNDFLFEQSKKNTSNILKLLNKRSLRIAPQIDKKILTDWNAMLVSALVRAFVAFGDSKYLDKAEKIYSFIYNKHFINNELYHSSCNGILGAKGLLDDYANLIRACFLLYEVSGDLEKLHVAKKLINFTKKNFYETNISDFYFTNKNETDLFLRTTNKLDNATQSGSSMMLENLIKSYYYFGNEDDDKIVKSSLAGSWKNVKASPISHIGYIVAAHMKLSAHHFVALIKNDSFGSEVKEYLLKLSAFSVLTFFYDEKTVPKNSVIGNKRYINNKSTVYVCRGFVCSSPITNMNEMNKWAKQNILLNKEV